MSNMPYDFERARTAFQNRVEFTTGTHELDVLLKSDTDPASYQVIDVRFPDDFLQGHVPGAVNLPMAKWSNRRYLDDHLDRNATLYLYCYSPTCHLAAQAAVKLVDAGYRVIEVEGGWSDWQQHGYDIEKPAGRRSA